MKEKSKFRKYVDSHLWLKKLVAFLFFKLYYRLTAPFRIFRTIEQQDRYLAQLNVVTETHKDTFGEYKNKYNGKDIVIIATGPSLNKYKPIPNTVAIGVNKACLCDKVTLDYFFAADYLTTKDYLDTLKEYKNKNLKIFIGRYPQQALGFPELKIVTIMPESKIIELGAKKYYTYSKYPPYNVNFHTDIDKTWIAEGSSTIFATMQFALFTNPRRIYIVGCDCSNGYFDADVKKVKKNKGFIRVWKELKKFRDYYYPDTEIISVNPVGLKGLFTDLYQDEVNSEC